ncbi:MAG: CARDB domain-containing protein [Gammaproteobacteria bacterium]
MKTHLSIFNHCAVMNIYSTICFVTLASLYFYSNTSFAATSNVSQVFHNPRIYTAIFNEETQEYDEIVSENSGTATLPDPIEYEVEFGGTCSDESLLETSNIKLVGDTNINTHTWQIDESEGMERKSFGSSYTQHQHLLKACNSELRNIIDGDPTFLHGVTLEQLKDTSFTIWEVRTHRVQHTLHCSDGTKAQKLDDINTSIICSAAKVTPKRKKVKVVKAKLKGVSHGMQTQCPVDASLDIQIQTNKAMDVQYKVVSGTGLVSHTKTMAVDEKVADKTYEGNASIPFSVPMDYEPPAGSSSATNDIQTNQTLENEYTQSFRIEISKPHEAKSDYVDYYVTCIPTVNPGFGAVAKINKTSPKQTNSHRTIKKMDASKIKKLGGSKATTQASVASGLATGKRQHSPAIVENEAGVMAAKPAHKAASDLHTNVLPDLILSAFIYDVVFQGNSVVAEASNAKSKNNGICFYDLDYHVSNNSSTKVSSEFKNTIQINGTIVKQHIISSNPTGGKLFAKIPIGLKEGMNTLIISIDAENSVNESKENNNTFERNIVVNGSCKGLATGKRPAEKKPIFKNKIQNQKIKPLENLSR